MRTSCKFKERAVNLGGQGADVLGRACQAEAQNRPYLTLRFEQDQDLEYFVRLDPDTYQNKAKNSVPTHSLRTMLWIWNNLF